MRAFSLALLAAGLALSAGLAYWRFLHGQPALDDFAAIYGKGPLPLLRPPFYRPLAILPFPAAAALWLVLNAAAGLAFGAWAALRTREPAMAILLAFFVPAIVSLSVGQDSLLLLAVLAGVFLLLESKRPFTAGLLLSLLWVKFQFLPAFLLLLAVRKDWPALGGFGLGTVALLGSVAKELPAYASYLAEAASHPRVVPCRPCMPNLHALAPWPGPALALSAALLAVSALRFRVPLEPAFALAASAALLSSHHAHIYDCVLLFLAVVLMMERKSEDRPPAWLGLAISPLPYLLPYLWSPARILPALMAAAVWLVAFRRSK